MANVTRKRTGELLRALFDLLIPHPEGVPAGEALKQLVLKVPPNEYEQGHFESGGNRYEKIVRWATVDCVKAGWMVKNHGRWAVTDAGREALQSLPDPEAFYRRAVALYNQWKSGQEAPAAQPPSDAVITGVVPSAQGASITYEQADEQAWSEIERYLQAMPPYDFQALVASLLRAMGYHVGWDAPPGKDGGVDLIAYTDPLGTRPPRIKVQVKRQQQRVAVDGLRSFMALLGADDVGIFVNAGGFTKDAELEARTQQTRHVTLIDLERLVDLWVEHFARLDESAKRRLPLQPIYFLAPEA
jgi:restriction system protein